MPPPQAVPMAEVVPQPKYDPSSYWHGDAYSGQPSILISLTKQRAAFYKGGLLVGESPISSGREQFPTPAGTYKILQKDANYKSGQYGQYVAADGTVLDPDVDTKVEPKPPGARFVGAPMPYFMRITDGIGMHVGHLPGYPASHGCIRMPRDMARVFFDNVQVGTPVTVLP